tara:strand:- start:1389 stop:1532 length:144 start_codon:yes stop_codon:yes gene_type:complete
MSLKAEIKKSFLNNKGIKSQKINIRAPRKTLNNKWKVYTVDVYVKNE